MIIGLCGRLQSGKTELSKICEKYGYERLFFALPLKMLIANLIGKSIEDVNKLKTIDSEYILNEEKIEYLSNETEIPLDVINKYVKNKVFKNTREMLQYIGTDIIRKENPDWHVNKIRSMIDVTKNYVIDDVRFPNEKLMIEENNGILFFIVRPLLTNISNHESETSLNWFQFDNIIINDTNLECLKFKWETFVSNGLAQSMIKRVQVINRINTDTDFRNNFLNSSDNELSMFDMLFINKCEFSYNPKYIKNSSNLSNIEKIENFNDCLFRVYNTNKTIEIVDNPLMIEDLKLYYNANE